VWSCLPICMNPKPAFIIALLLLLPLAGCIDPTDAAGAIGTGTSSTDDAGNTTIWQNETYYVNETHIIQQTVLAPERDIHIASGYAGCLSWQNNTSSGREECISSEMAQPSEVSFFSIPVNSTVSILGGNTWGTTGNIVYGQLVCNSGYTQIFSLGSTYTLGHVPSDGSGCTAFNPQPMTGYWSVIYEIHNATVD